MAYKCWQAGADRGAVKVQAESGDIAASMFARLVLGPAAADPSPGPIAVLVEDDALLPETFVFRITRVFDEGRPRWLATYEGAVANRSPGPRLAQSSTPRLS